MTRLRADVLEQMKEHPEGISMYDMADNLGCSRMGVHYGVRALMNEGFPILREKVGTRSHYHLNESAESPAVDALSLEVVAFEKEVKEEVDGKPSPEKVYEAIREAGAKGIRGVDLALRLGVCLDTIHKYVRALRQKGKPIALKGWARSAVYILAPFVDVLDLVQTSEKYCGMIGGALSANDVNVQRLNTQVLDARDFERVNGSMLRLVYLHNGLIERMIYQQAQLTGVALPMRQIFAGQA